jgi:hypothetical protein
MSFVEDPTVFFVDFGVAATLNGVAVTVIFDSEYLDELGFIGGSNPRAAIVSTENPAKGNTLIINGVSYTVLKPMPDGTGITVMELNKT